MKLGDAGCGGWRFVGAGVQRFLSIAAAMMLPGVGHCGGGEGPDLVNLVDQIVAWVEDSQQPGSVQAVRKVYGRVVDDRAIAPYVPAS